LLRLEDEVPPQALDEGSAVAVSMSCLEGAVSEVIELLDVVTEPLASQMDRGICDSGWEQDIRQGGGVAEDALLPDGDGPTVGTGGPGDLWLLECQQPIMRRLTTAIWAPGWGFDVVRTACHRVVVPRRERTFEGVKEA